MALELDLYAGYPEPKEPRIVGPELRTIHNRIAASYRAKEFYDGDRINGYGGMKDDGRWVPIAANIIRTYELKPNSLVLQVGAHKGFLVKALQDQGMKAMGSEPSHYARSQSPVWLRNAPFTRLPFQDREFDLVIGASCVYTLNLPDAIKCLKEIQRVGRGHAWVTLAAAETPEEVMMLRYWFLLGTTILKREEWIAVMQHAGYVGDWRFDTVQSLNLRLA